MTITLRPYPAYKDSGVEWLGKVPEHWEVRRLKYLFQEVDDRTQTGEERLLSLRMREGLVDHLEAGGKPVTATALVGYKRIYPRQMVMNRMRAASGLFAVAESPGIVSPDYAIFDTSPLAVPQCYLSLFKSPRLSAVFRAESKGLGTGEAGFLRLYTDRFGNITVPLPPLHEQQTIVRLMAGLNGRIRRFIRAKRRMIALLNEQKQAIIHRAVTRGLNPDVRLKPSGVEWLGEVPEHWGVIRLRRLIQLNPSKGEAASRLRVAPEVTFLPMECVTPEGELNTKYIRHYFEFWSGFTYFRRNDVILAKITPCFENGKGACLSELPTEFGFGSTEFHILRAGRCVRPEYLRLLTSLKTFLRLGAEAMTGAAGQKRLPADFVRNFTVGLPPLQEQDGIVEEIFRHNKKIDDGITCARSEISLVQEYRTRLITDVVTGKLDVRGIEIQDVLDELGGNLEDEEIEPSEDLDGTLDKEVDESEDS